MLSHVMVLRLLHVVQLQMGRGFSMYRAVCLAFCTSVLARHPIPFRVAQCVSMMHSVSHNTSDGSVRLETNTPVPTLRKGDVLVKVGFRGVSLNSRYQCPACLQVAATAVNRADLLQARGRYPPPPGESEILGLESMYLLATYWSSQIEYLILVW